MSCVNFCGDFRSKYTLDLANDLLLGNSKKINNPSEWKSRYQVEELVKGRWGEFNCVWEERGLTNQNLIHNFRTIVDLKTGQVYNHNKIPKIRQKSAALIVGYLLFSGVLKTIYHAMLPISLIREVIRADKGEKIIAAARNVFDIIRSPLYAIVLSFCALVTAILGVCNSDRVYDMRAIIAQIQTSMNWGKERTEWTLARCFQPIVQLDQFATTWGNRKFDDTVYPSDATPEAIAAANLTRATVRYRRNHALFFSGCRKLPSTVAFDSRQTQ